MSWMRVEKRAPSQPLNTNNSLRTSLNLWYMTSIACKVTFNNETRRVMLDNAGSTTFHKLQQLVNELFNQKLPSSYTLMYTDDEGDKITLSTDKEVAEAIRLMKLINSNYLRLTVSVGHAFPKDDERKSEEKTSWSFVDKKDFDSNATADKQTSRTFTLLQTFAQQMRTKRIFQKESIQTALQRAFSNPEVLRNPSEMESIMKSLCEGNQEFRSFYNRVTQKMAEISGPPAVHHGVTCDRSGMTPIIGNRYKKRDENYDLCESEYQKLHRREGEIRKNCQTL